MLRFIDFSKFLTFVDHFVIAFHDVSNIYYFCYMKCMFDLFIYNLIVVVFISFVIFIIFVHSKCILFSNSSSIYNDIDFAIHLNR